MDRPILKPPAAARLINTFGVPYVVVRRHCRYQDYDTSCTMGYKYWMSVTQEALPLLSFGYYRVMISRCMLDYLVETAACCRVVDCNS
eukprot:scaffold31198_cov39-Attheya_sp.AAC.1